MNFSPSTRGSLDPSMDLGIDKAGAQNCKKCKCSNVYYYGYRIWMPLILFIMYDLMI